MKEIPWNLGKSLLEIVKWLILLYIHSRIKTILVTIE